MVSIIGKAKAKFYRVVSSFGSDPFHLLPHVVEMEKWALRMLKKYAKADREVVLLAVWLHDIGHYPVDRRVDHAITSEQMARKFLLKEDYPKNRMEKVLHCIRAHRSRDVIPASFEAKIIAFIDSASHITEPMYFDIARCDKENKIKFRVYEKMKRDYKDLDAFPEIKEELKELYESWKKLLKVYEKMDL